MLMQFGPCNNVENIKKVGWLIYVVTKNEICGKSRNIIEYTCLLIPLLELLIQSNPKAFEKVAPETPLRDQICNLFQIKLGNAIEQICQMFQSTILQIVKPLEFIKSMDDFTAIWEKDKLAKITNLLGKVTKNGPIPDIDESVFTQEPVEFSGLSFEFQKVINVHVTPIKLSTQLKRSPTKTPKILSPSRCEVTLNNKLSEVALDGYNIPCRTVLNELTPIASTISMNNWLQICLNKPQFNNSSISALDRKSVV